MIEQSYKVDEVVKALEVIKRVCEEQYYEYDECICCPIYKSGSCAINEDTPRDWKINTPTWRAFDER